MKAFIETNLRIPAQSSGAPSFQFQISSCSSFDYVFDKFLQLGSQGCDVAELQSALATDALLYPEKAVNGFFDTPTENAVKKFQIRYAIATSGECLTTGFGCVGSKTRAKLNEAFGVKPPPSLSAGQPLRTSPFDQTSIQGTLEVFHSDDFQYPKNLKFIFYLRSENRRYELKTKKQFPLARSGALVKVLGRIDADKFILNDTLSNSFQVLAQEDIAISSAENIGPQHTIGIVARTASLLAPTNVSGASTMLFDLEEGDDYTSVNEFYIKTSFSRVSLNGTVVGPYTLSDFQVCDVENMVAQAINAADNQVDFRDYKRIIIFIPQGHCTFSGYASIGMVTLHTDDGDIQASWSLNFSASQSLVAHELGHQFGLAHANAIYCTGCEDIGNKSNERGDVFDVMGHGFGHFNAAHKEEAGWLSAENSVVATSGEYLLKPLEISQPQSAIQQIKLPLARVPDFYSWYAGPVYISLEFRQPIDLDAGASSNAAMYSGVFLHYSIVPSPHPAATNLINFNFSDFSPLLQVDHPYDNPVNNYHVTLKSITPDGALVSVTSSTSTSSIQTFVLTPPSATIQVGSTQQFQGIYNPTGDTQKTPDETIDPKLVMWSSSNKNVATIESPGVFKGVTEGQVTVTGTYDAVPGTMDIIATAKLTITAEPPPPPPDTSTFVIVPDVSTIKVGESVTLEGRYEPDGPDGEKPEQTISGSNMSWAVPLVDGKEIVTGAEGGTFKGVTVGTVKMSGTVVTGGIGEGRTASATINVIEDLAITTASLPEGVAGTYYSVILEAKGGLRASGDIPYHWELSGTLPPIVGLDPLLGKIRGTITPGTKGTYDIVVTVIDDTGTRVSKPLTLVVKHFGYDTNREDLIITTKTLPDAQLNQYYETHFAAEGGDPSSYYWYYAGRLPGGITFFHEEGKYAGLPLETGIFKFILQVSDAQGHLDTQPVSITIYPLSPSLKIIPERSTVKVGETLQLGAIYDPDGSGPEAEYALAGNESTWQSSDSSIATVTNGLVNGNKPDNVRIITAYHNLSAQTPLTVDQAFFDCRWRNRRERAQGQCTGEESCTIFGQWSGNIENLRCPAPPELPPEPGRRFFDCQWNETRPCASGDRNSCKGTESCTVVDGAGSVKMYNALMMKKKCG